MRTLTRGSRLPLPPDYKVLRFFVWWKNGVERTDIDLSAAMFDGEFGYKDVISYYDLKKNYGCHSGDIVDAPEGASEFIDLSLERMLEKNIRYVVMSLTSYTQQPYCNLPECFAGWMAREKPESGEIYEPKTVQDKLDITADTRIAIPLIIDLEAREIIWCDMALRRNPNWQNHVHGNLKGIALTLQALVHLKKPTLFDLLRLHAASRGEVVSSPEQADTVFSAESDLPFRLEEIAAEYLL